MTAAARQESKLSEQIAAIREFNRFYTARLGLLRRRHLDGEFSLTEARTLYEIGASPGSTASALRSILELDAGYLSRVLATLSRRGLVRQVPSKRDGREKSLTLTAMGERAVARLNEQSTAQLRGMLEKVSGTDRDALVASLRTARRVLHGERRPVRIERLAADSPGAIRVALALLEEYYEAVHVVLRDKPGIVQSLMQEPGSGIWLAYAGEATSSSTFRGEPRSEALGCVVLRRLESIPSAGECKRLYVKPVARGQGIADRLLDAQEAFAREQGLKWIYLDTYDDLTTAIALYERRGYKRCARYNYNPQATLFLRKRIA